MSIVSIIIPTWNNPQYLMPCVNSILRHTAPDDLYRIYIINNGQPEHMIPFKDNPYITILQMSENVGWEGGLEAGIKASNEPYLLFLNDDTQIMSHQVNWLANLLNNMGDPNCAAVGPSSNVVMGKQNIFNPIVEPSLRVKYLIGFCMLVRRSDLEAAGGIDRSLPGGDDLDLSIRLRQLGRYLVADRNVFVWHHGFKTGERLEGPATAENGWNSIQKIERTNFALINKHGLKPFLDLWKSEEGPSPFASTAWPDSEADLVRKYVHGEKIAELGCGPKKTVDNAIGIDMIPKGQEIPGLGRGQLSLADFVGNVETDLPVSDCDTIIARHILEHLVDATGAVKAWRRSLKDGGRLIIAVPDHSVRNTIPLNWQHVHAYTPDSLKRFMESLGWETEAIEDCQNQVSFLGVFKANGFH